MVCTVATVSVSGRRVAVGINGEDWPGQHCNLFSLKSAANCGPVAKGSGNGFIIGSAGNVFIFKKREKNKGLASDQKTLSKSLQVQL